MRTLSNVGEAGKFITDNGISHEYFTYPPPGGYDLQYRWCLQVPYLFYLLT
jgi:hypothetical protein